MCKVKLREFENLRNTISGRRKDGVSNEMNIAHCFGMHYLNTLGTEAVKYFHSITKWLNYKIPRSIVWV